MRHPPRPSSRAPGGSPGARPVPAPVEHGRDPLARSWSRRQRVQRYADQVLRRGATLQLQSKSTSDTTLDVVKALPTDRRDLQVRRRPARTRSLPRRRKYDTCGPQTGFVSALRRPTSWCARLLLAPLNPNVTANRGDAGRRPQRVQRQQPVELTPGTPPRPPLRLAWAATPSSRQSDPPAGITYLKPRAAQHRAGYRQDTLTILSTARGGHGISARRQRHLQLQTLSPYADRCGHQASIRSTWACDGSVVTNRALLTSLAASMRADTLT